jgi:hypothetical protein
MGDPNPRSFSRGKRGIAGSMTFITMDRTALWEVMHSKDHYYYAHPLEIVGSSSDTTVTEDAATVTSTGVGYLTESADASGTVVANPVNAGAGESIGQYNFQNFGRDIWSLSNMMSEMVSEGNDIESLKTQAVYYDQIPPFNTVLVGQNEAGYAFVSSLIGQEILNMGGGLSIDDITNEEQCTYIARFWNAWKPFSTNESGTTIGTAAQGSSAINVDVLNPFTTVKATPTAV